MGELEVFDERTLLVFVSEGTEGGRKSTGGENIMPEWLERRSPEHAGTAVKGFINPEAKRGRKGLAGWPGKENWRKAPQPEEQSI